MFRIAYQGRNVTCGEEETILEAMIRQGVKFPFSCRKGSCHACLHVAEEGNLPSESQKGLSEEQIQAGCFLPCLCKPVDDLSIVAQKGKQNRSKRASQLSDQGFCSPDPEMWEALGEGYVLSEILDDFYNRAFSDDRLEPFFHGVTQQRAREKQYLFLRQIFTGEKVYFGDRPKNAHHWMVISDELFDYREALMMDCLRRHGLPDNLIERWRNMENSFRADIVKDTPWKRKFGDLELPVDGYDEVALDVGSVCDGCGGEVNAGVTVRYHLRLGTLYCPECISA